MRTVQHPCRRTGTGAKTTTLAMAHHRHSTAATGWVGTHTLAGVCRRTQDSAGTARAHLPADLPVAAGPSSTLTRGTLVPLNLGRLDRAGGNLEYSAGRHCCTGCAIATLTLVGCTASCKGTAREHHARTRHLTTVPIAPHPAGTAATGWVGMRRRHGRCLAIQDWAGTRQVPAAKALPALRHRWTRIRVIPSLVLPSPAEYRNLLSTTRPHADVSAGTCDGAGCEL